MGKHLVNGMPANPDIGDIYYDISDGAIKIPGNSDIHVFGKDVYLLNDIHSLTAEALSDDIEYVIGSYDALRRAILDGMVIMDNRTMDYNYDRLVAVEALDGGNEMFISLAFHSGPSTTRRYTISRDNNGGLSLTVTESGPFLEKDTNYGMLETEDKTVLGAISEHHSDIYLKDYVPIPLTEHTVDGGSGYWSATSGNWLSSSLRWSSEKIPVKTGDRYRVTTAIGSSAYIAYLGQWNGDEWVGVPDGFAAGTGNAEDREYVVPAGVTHIAICSYDSSEEPTLKRYGNVVRFYTKEETEEALIGLQPKTDETLQTEDKTIAGAINELYSNIPGGAGVNPLWCGRVSSTGVATKNSGTLASITVNRSGEGVYGIKGAPAGRTVIVSPLDYFVGSASLVTAPHIAVVSQSSTGILTVRMYTLDGTLDDFGFSLMII